MDETTNAAANSGGGGDTIILIMMAVGGLVFFAAIIAMLVGMIKTYSKMGYSDSWWLIVPILNYVFWVKVAEKPMWWVVLFFTPVGGLVGLYIHWLMSEKVGNAYGKSPIMIFLFGIVFYPILGFGSAQPTITAPATQALAA